MVEAFQNIPRARVIVAKKKAAAATAEPETPVEAPVETAGVKEEPKPAPKAAAEMTKTDAIKAALQAGYLKPIDGVKYIKDTFGIDVSTNVFTTTKSQHKDWWSDSPAKTKTASPKPKATKTATSTVAAAPITNGTPSSGSLVQGVKALVEKYGAADVGEVLELLKK